MLNQDKEINKKRNPFVALCEYASNNNWCWKLFCTTCGHSGFRVAFSKIIQDQHPDSDSFWPSGKSNSDMSSEIKKYNDFWKKTSIEDQLKLATIVAKAKILDIQPIAKFPDWLGYIGLVINHCPSCEARKIISDSFIPQFITMLRDNEEIVSYLQEKVSKNEMLSINDLSRIESRNINLSNSPQPLIFDVL